MKRALAALAAATFLSSCSLGPFFEKPEIVTPPAWVQQTDGANVWPDRTWWEGFGSAELDSFVAAATTGNYDLAAALSRIRQAEAQVRVAGAALLPSISAGAGANRNFTGRTSTTGATSRAVSNTYQASLNASYQLDLFGGNKSNAEASAARLQSSQFDRETVAITLHSDVASTYFLVLSLRDRIRLAEDTLRIAEEVLSVVQARLSLGAGSDLEVAQQRSTVASQRAAVVALQQAETETINALAVLLGRNPEGFMVQGNSLGDLQLPQVAAGLPSELLLRRPDLRSAEAGLRAGKFDVAAARAARFPSIDLSLQGGGQSAALSGLFGPGGLFVGFGASLAAPIFEGGRLQAQEDLSAARYQELELTYRSAILAAFRDTENALSSTTTSTSQYGYAREAYDQAREAYRIVEVQLRAGSVDFVTLLDAQRTVFQANDGLVQADLARYNALVTLFEALGGGWDGTTATP